MADEDISLKFRTNAKVVQKDLRKLTESMQNLGTNVSHLKKKFDGNAKTLNKNNKLLHKFNADANRNAKIIRNLADNVDYSTRSFKKFNKAINTGLLVGLTIKLGDFIQSSLDTIETVNLFNVSMGESAVATDKLLENISEVTGLDLNNLREATGTFTLLATSMGMSNENASILGETTTRLALDLSSLVNVPFTQAMEDLRSGLVGQTETVYKYGVDLTEASLQQTAMLLGIEQSTRTMSQSQKMWLRYVTMLRQTTKAQGDFAKTIETPANQLRILGERMTTLGRNIGSFFINSLGSILPYINAVVKGLNLIISTLARLLGFEPPKIENTTSAMADFVGQTEEAGASVDSLNKKLKDIYLPFDELNALPQPSAGGGGGGGEDLLGGDFGKLPTYDSGLDKIKTKTDEILDKMLNWLGLQRELNELSIIPDGYIDQINKAIQNEDFYTVGFTVATMLNDGVVKAIEKVSWDNVGETITTKLTHVADTINGFFGNKDLFANTGILLGEALNTAVNSAFVLLSNIDAKNIGDSIGTTINKFIETTDWTNVAVTLVTGFQKAFEVLGSILATIDWSEVVVALGEVLSTIVKESFAWLLSADDTSDVIAQTLLGLFLSKKVLGIGKKANTFLGKILGDTGKGKTSSDGGGVSIKNTEKAFSKLSGTLSKISKPLLFVGELLGSKLVSGITKLIPLISGGLVTALGFLTSPIGLILTAVAGLVALVVTNWDTIKPILESAKEYIQGLWDKIKLFWDAVAVGIAVWWENDIKPWFTIERWQQLWEDVKSAFSNGWETIKTWWQNSALYKWWDEDVKIWFKLKTWEDLWIDVKTSVKNGWDTVKKWWNESALVKWFTDDVKPWFTLDKWLGVWQTIKDSASTTWDNIKTWFKDKVAPKFEKDYWVNKLIGFKDGLKQAAQDGINAVIGLFEKGINFIIGKINGLSFDVPDSIADKIGIKTFGFHVEPVKIDRVQLARGGMLQSGQLFEAGEMGKSEVIGSYQGKTTVMPLENSGFVEAMYNAVYKAVADAQGKGGQVIENVLKLDGEVIYKNQEKVKSRKGVNFGLAEFSR